MSIPAQQFTVFAKTRFLAAAVMHRATVGTTLADVVAAVGIHKRDLPYTSVHLGERRMPAQSWRMIRPKHGTVVRVTVVPQGGNMLQTAAFLALAVGVAVAAPYLAPVLLGAGASTTALAATTAVIGAGGTIVGGLLINALIPVAQQTMGSLSGNPASTYSISGARNRADPWGPVPVVLGKHRVYGRLGANTYTEVVGNDQYLRVLIVWGYGPVSLSNLRIGETAITSFDDVEVEHSLDGDDTDLTLFPGIVVEDSTAVTLVAGADRTIRTTEPDTDEVSLDFLFPLGLYTLGRKTGDRNSCGVYLEIERRVTGSGDPWTVIQAEFEIRALETTPYRQGYRFAMPARGQYDIAVRCTAQQSGGGQEFQEVQLAALRSITNTDPIALSGVAKTAIRIKASDQLYDEVDEINADIQLVCPNWDGTDWDTVEATRNPASLFRWVLTGPANPSPVDEASVDDAALGAWHEHCEEMEWECDLVVDTAASVLDTLRTIASTGWASPDFIDGKWTVLVDKQQDTVRQWFTPRNTVRGSFSGAITYPDTPHAFRCRFINRNKRYEQDELIAYAQGYNASTATLFEGLELPGVTKRKQVAVLARRHLVQATLRREAISFTADLDGLVVQRGDLIGISNDVLLVGTGAARIKEARVSSGYVPVLELDGDVTIEGAGYAVRISHLDGTSSLHTLAESYGDTRTLNLVDAIPEVDAPPVGSLAMVGPADEETSRWLVRSIAPAADWRAEIVAVPEAAGIYTYTFADDIDETAITGDAGELVPAFANIESGGRALLRSTDGAFIPRIIVTFRHDSARPLRKTNAIEVQYRDAASATWLAAGFTNDSLKATIAEVQQGKTYQLRARFRFATGGKSMWAGPVTHMVVGVTDPPPDVTWSQLEEDRVVWRFASPPVDHRGFRVRWSANANANWSEATDATDGVIRVTEFPRARLPNNARLVMIKAVDAAGNLSLNPARVALVDQADLPWRYISTTDLAATSYPGTKQSAVVVASVGGNPATLQATSSNQFIPAPGTAPFITSAEGAFIEDRRLRYTYTAKITVPPSVVDGDRMQVRVQDIDDEGDYEVLYRRSDALSVTTPFANGLNWSTGFGWAAGEEGYYAPVAQYIPAPPAGSTVVIRIKGRSTLESIKVSFRARPLSERVEDLYLPTTGVRVPLTKTFRRYAAVVYSIQGDNSLIRSVVVSKKTNLQTGPFLRAYSQAGAAQEGTVDVTVEGD